MLLLDTGATALKCLCEMVSKFVIGDLSGLKTTFDQVNS